MRDRREGSQEPDSRHRRHGAVGSADDHAFVSELARRLQGQGPALALPLTWIEQRLAESNLTIDQMVQLETSSRRPTRFRSATASAACASWARSTGANSSKDQRRRANIARGSRGRLRPHGFRHARPLSPCRGAHGKGKPVIRSGGGARRHPTGTRGRGKRERECEGACRLLSDRRGTAGARRLRHRFRLPGSGAESRVPPA